MSAISIETKKISELTAASAAVDNDLLILRKSDGTGVKAISVANLRNIITGLLSDLDTTDKDSIVDAVNEVVAHVTEHAEWLDGLQELFDHFGLDDAEDEDHPHDQRQEADVIEHALDQHAALPQLRHEHEGSRRGEAEQEG